MGVKSCDRVGCTNVMCNTYVNTSVFRGYICNECKEEFKQWLNNGVINGISHSMNDNNIARYLSEFMETYANSFSCNETNSVDTFFEYYTEDE